MTTVIQNPNAPSTKGSGWPKRPNSETQNANLNNKVPVSQSLTLNRTINLYVLSFN